MVHYTRTEPGHGGLRYRPLSPRLREGNQGCRSLRLRRLGGGDRVEDIPIPSALVITSPAPPYPAQDLLISENHMFVGTDDFTSQLSQFLRGKNQYRYLYFVRFCECQNVKPDPFPMLIKVDPGSIQRWEKEKIPLINISNPKLITF